MKAGLIRLVQFYRSHMSQRFPFSKMSCSFHSETCSQYATRVLASDMSLGRSLSLITQRLRRCEQASIYKSGQAWVWGPHYDMSPKQRDELLVQAMELPQTRTSLHATAFMLSCYRQGKSYGSFKHASLVRIRSRRAFEKSILIKLAFPLSLMLLVMFVLLLLFPLLAVIFGLGAFVWFSLLLHRQWCRWRRFQQIEAAGLFRVQ